MQLAEWLSMNARVVRYSFAIGQSVIIWLEASIYSLPANNDDGLVSLVWNDSPSLRGS